MTMKISLPEEFGAFVDAQVTSGQYATPDDVVREALRLMETRQSKLAWLQNAYREGIESGDHGPLDIEALISEARATRDKGG